MSKPTREVVAECAPFRSLLEKSSKKPAVGEKVDDDGVPQYTKANH